MKEHRGSQLAVMEKSWTAFWCVVHHRNAPQRCTRLTGILLYINSEHLHHILSPSMTHQTLPDRLSQSTDTVKVQNIDLVKKKKSYATSLNI